MSFHDRAAPLPGSLSSSVGPSTGHLFLALALLQIAATLVLNRIVLNDDVLRSLFLETGRGDDLLAATRRWEIVSYLTIPILLAIRIGTAALLVQLILLGLRTVPAFGRIFRAGLWAQGALILGTVIQAGWLASLPDGAIGPEILTSIPGSFGAILPALGENPSPLLQLVHRISVFDLGWMALFVLGLEERGEVPVARAAAAVVSVWMVLTLGKWAFLQYMASFA